MLKKERASYRNALVVSGGDEFAIPISGLSEREKDEVDLQALAMMGYDAVAIGETEFTQGLDFLARQIAKYPFLISSNIVWSETRKPLAPPAIYRSYQLKAEPGRPARSVRVAVLAFLTPKHKLELERHLGSDARRIAVIDHIAEARRLIPQVRRKADLVVVLAHMSEEETRQLVAYVPGIDVAVMACSVSLNGRKIAVPLRVDNALLVASNNDGKYLGRLALALNGAGKIAQDSGSEQQLGPDVPSDKAVLALVEKITKTAATELPPPRSQLAASATFAGAATCANCHSAEHRQWLGTAHAKAHGTLKRRGQQNLRKAECQRCHSVGYGEPGGFVSIDATPGLAGVQCESCHLAGVNHARATEGLNRRSTIFRRVPESVCKRCHDKDNDPHFDYAKKLPLVKH